MATPFTQGQRKFIDDLHRRTGLDRRVIGSWVLSEMNGGAARSREAERNYNWLNIAYYDTGPGGITKSGVWRNPSSAAAATADFLKGKRFGPSPGIRKIIKYAGKSPDEQINAIANSGWASSGYDGGSTLRSVYGRLDWMGKGTTPTATTSARPASTAAAAPSSAAPVRRQLAAQWLLSKSKNPNDLLYQIQQAGASADPAVAETPQQEQQQPASQAGGTADVYTARANRIDSWQKPYLWGGGHGGKVSLSKPQPLDCSGAVSAVLGIDPRVSGQFQSWGRPGRAPGGRGVTIYSNAEHVLMEIDGRFWGTSKSNPGGGAGWIPRSQVSASYLSRFTARHSRR